MTNYPVHYQSTWNYSGVGQQMYPQYGQQGITQNVPQSQTSGTCMHGLIWVDGEIGAKAYQLPQGLPANQPIALWDTNDTIIYLKSVNPMGMPNPLQKAHYTLEGVKSGVKDQGYSEDTEPVKLPDMTQYVRKDDLERMKQDLMDTIGQMQTSGTGVRKTTAKGAD